jgi:hypothetical protein
MLKAEGEWVVYTYVYHMHTWGLHLSEPTLRAVGGLPSVARHIILPSRVLGTGGLPSVARLVMLLARVLLFSAFR